MTLVLSVINQIKPKINYTEKIAIFTSKHPALSIVAAFVIAPVAVVAAVSLATCAVVIPLSLIFGF